MTVSRFMRILFVSAMFTIGAFTMIMPAQALELAPGNEPAQTEDGTDPDTAVSSDDPQILTTTDEPLQYSDGQEPYATGVVQDGTDTTTNEFFPEITVTTRPPETEEVAYGGVKFVAGDTVVVQQEKAVDVFAAANAISVEEDLSGDLFAAANSIAINAYVDGSVRVAGNTVTINADVARNVLVFANTVYIAPGVTIGGHANIFAAQVVMEGTVNQSFSAAAEQVSVNGAIMGTTDIQAQQVTLGEKTLINEAGTIKASQEPTVHTEAIGEELLVYEYVTQRELEKDDRTDHILSRAQQWTASFFFFLIIGGLMILIWPEWTRRVSTTIEKEFSNSAQKGLVYLFLVPLILFVAFFTVILIPLSAIAAPLYALTIVFGRVFVGMMLGRHLVNKKFKDPRKQLLLEWLIGYFVVSVLLSLPIIGWFICMLAGAWGVGGVLQDWSNQRNRKKKA